MAKSLVMSFLNEDGKKSNVTINNAKGDVTSEEVKAAMNLIIEKNLFNSKGGDLVSSKEAYILDRVKTEIKL
ncbi:hypothetical protein CLOACE_09970 [Clostridium acetireducens DSM 10703]|jgi:hypothetical protein|uniref:DUF2922 domain-containing protein n=1 Tax=Clostridium acetireducens DSM 10703 TaxID=1121290 RepID=A0A1E8F048_9CLOT|nr:DUF2922 domain-containing protein [Clostridium acetireducens]OFI06497.1 hypothetical protein CLOACE_09970 [Clostridium acetireducens DSM 10703]